MMFRVQPILSLRYSFVFLACLLSASCQLEFDNFKLTISSNTVIDQPVDDPDYTQTAHPIVLIHGLNGFDSIFSLDYFHFVPEALEAGGATVFMPKMSSLNTNEVRGEQLINFLEDQKAIDPTIEKFNLIAHSQGAMTARYVAAVRGDLIASVTTVGGVNKLGSERAAMITESYQSIWGTVLMDVSFAMLGVLLDNISSRPAGLPQNPRGAFESVSYEGTEEFNERYPAGIFDGCDPNPDTVIVHDIYYFSWGAVGYKTNPLDPMDKLLEVTIDRFPDDQNDGSVSTCTAHLGMVIKDNYSPMNHTDLTNQALGLIHPNAPNPLTLYRMHANRLKATGL
ncbi:MAG: triacylglycerol lipase [Cellvibrionales bacterium]|nr:triacylglycerol lipase [Cellvibrionales bacterium]